MLCKGAKQCQAGARQDKKKQITPYGHAANASYPEDNERKADQMPEPGFEVAPIAEQQGVDFTMNELPDRKDGPKGKPAKECVLPNEYSLDDVGQSLPRRVIDIE